MSGMAKSVTFITATQLPWRLSKCTVDRITPSRASMFRDLFESSCASPARMMRGSRHSRCSEKVPLSTIFPAARVSHSRRSRMTPRLEIFAMGCSGPVQ
ncbi:hypothetical protein DQ04_01481120 [Trypanosoma grayi]|uniref:hypothetical protein n=1 Tax=Trypanosoma grayi TaxID=71804 RepID=UPI0004F3F6B7|nr:hypothetical protein DQ04_01481120 [Trypanosoma grayi]KEG12709.1 hypothetical protein DQ04_01481120 [Trypanosoma grayi]